MTTKWSFAIALLVALVALPLTVDAGHRHRHRGHHGGGYSQGGYGGDCGCCGQVQYAPPVHAQYGQPTPAGVQVGAGYQSFSYDPTASGESFGQAPAPVMSGPAYQPAGVYPQTYYGGYDGGYSSGGRGVRAYNNAANKSLGNHDYGLGRR